MIHFDPDLLPYRLTICGIAELGQFCQVGVTHVLSILDPQAPDPPAFGTFGEHRRTILRFDDVIEEWPNYQPPQDEHVAALLAFGQSLIDEAPAGEPHLLVHCHMGISRSTAAMGILLAQPNPGAERAAFRSVFTCRPRAWPNSRMVRIADRMLQRDGALVAALQAYQRDLLQTYPELAELVTTVGRGHELPR